MTLLLLLVVAATASAPGVDAGMPDRALGSVLWLPAVRWGGGGGEGGGGKGRGRGGAEGEARHWCCAWVRLLSLHAR